MAGGSLYQDEDSSVISDINVTPFVDVVLVLLVVFMVTAKLIVARGVEIDKAKMASGGEVQSTLRVSVTSEGKLFVNGDEYADDAAAIARIKTIAASAPGTPKALIAGDRRAEFGGVMRAIDVVRQAGVTAISLENERKP